MDISQLESNSMEFLVRTRLARRTLSLPLGQSDYSSLGEAVRHLRTEAGLTQEKLAHESGIHPTWISHIEQGRDNATRKTMASIAAGIGVLPSRIESLAEAYTEMAEANDDD
jgi:DNA-binding XRE family transcriptional regulator